MAPHELQGATLGERHRDYNQKLQAHVTAHHTVADVQADDTDVSQLLKIDIASNNRDVTYILEILKSDDMLYVSRALARSTWLITDQEYANIIHPDYLQAEMYPNMTSKAIFKFKKHIRHNIKDEERAEKFYLAEIKKDEAIKWLPNCSVTFIETNIEKYVESTFDNTLKLRLFKRLCERSTTIFEIVCKHLPGYDSKKYLQIATFLLHTTVINKYLDFIENTYRSVPKFNHKCTDLIMKHDPDRIKNKFEKYALVIHIPTFVRYLKAEEIKSFLNTQARKDFQNYEFQILRKIFQCDTLKYFVRRLPKDEQLEFVENLCIRSSNRGEGDDVNMEDPDTVQMYKLCISCNNDSYIWYQFAPFQHAFDEVTKLISQNPNNNAKRAMLYFLLTCAEHSLEHIQMILKYAVPILKNEEPCHQLQFVTQVLREVKHFDEKTWQTLNNLFVSMKIYDPSSDSSKHNTEIVNYVVVYHLLNAKKIPEVVEKQFSFNTLKSYKCNLNVEQRKVVFDYLFDHILSIVTNLEDKGDVKELVIKLENVLNLLQDWDKSLQDYPIILNKIRELIKLKKENACKESLASLYNVNKSWRKLMFEESLLLCPNEEVCLNALKHEPQLLTRYTGEVNTLRTDDAVSLKRLLAKLRIYWPHSLAQQWIDTYMRNINEIGAKKSTVRGLCTVLPQKPMLEIIERHKPESPKIDWKIINDRVLDMQRLLAKNMHTSRPHPNPEAILYYAKGDYLQFALPSLLAIFNNLNSPMNREYIPKLLDAPVSLQKHGIRLAFKKLAGEELKNIFLNCWKSSKNATIRSIIFKYTFKLLCNEKDTTNAFSLWQLLELFMDNLTFKDDKEVHMLLGNVHEVPLNVRANFLIKSYNFYEKLIPSLAEAERSHYKWKMTSLVEHSREVMETICPNFVARIIKDFVDKEFFNAERSSELYYNNGTISVMSAYLLCATNENDQIQKYEEILVPILRRSFKKWGEKHEGSFYIKNNCQLVLKRLSCDIKEYVLEKKKIIPVKMFTLIQDELEKSLSIPENYLILTKWKLTVALTKLVEQYPPTPEKWDEKICTEFGNTCLEYLKQDVTLHFSCIYLLFSKCVKEIIEMVPQEAIQAFYRSLLSDKAFIQGYLASIEIGSQHNKDDTFKPIWQQVFSHPSVEVKMHYYSKIEEKTM